MKPLNDNTLKIWKCLASILLVILHGVNLSAQLRPDNLSGRGHVILQKGDLKVEFVDNTSFGPLHKNGYNGIASLHHKNEERNILFPNMQDLIWNTFLGVTVWSSF
ncbi:MAG: hypothetical protein IPL46_31085 [Saprospiraceae bacterium]|nr:hypothetical protein [Saprospiraceae bacterium]